MNPAIRQALRLGGSALLFLLIVDAVALHLFFITHLPDPLIHPDTASYLTPALDGLFYHTWTMNLERTAGYPIFLYILLGLFRGFRSVLIVQHLLVVVTGLTAGLMARRYFHTSTTGAIVIATLTSLSPEAVIASHALLSDTLYAAGLVGCTLFFLSVCRSEKVSSLSWGLLGLGLAATVLIRPVGYALVASVAVLGMAVPQKRRPTLFALSVTLLLLLGYAGFNRAHFHYFGITQITGPRLFGLAARYVDPQGLEDPALKAALTPVYAAHRDKMTDTVWVRAAADGPVSAITRLYPDPQQSNHVFEQLSHQTLRQNMIPFIGLQLQLMGFFITQTVIPPDLYWQADYCFFFYRGLDLATALQTRYPAVREWLRQPPESGRRYLLAMRDSVRLPVAEGNAALEKLYAEMPYPYATVCLFWQPLAPFFHLYGIITVLALGLGIWLCRQKEIRFSAACLLVVILSQIALINTGGDSVGRYAVPMEPLIWILAVSGVEKLLAIRKWSG